ncbi:hypothetical protein GIB67_041253 [Kingdonia uniflora]|uniref:Uncharacterized protein n=1 Tax=Kingdonia uniflora TaxID=39325 RepID=A0A7J7P0C3_9MAGN|nr:hypothetical protein GIB67_041253 [Kingdonia uniflora]
MPKQNNLEGSGAVETDARTPDQEEHEDINEKAKNEKIGGTATSTTTTTNQEISGLSTSKQTLKRARKKAREDDKSAKDLANEQVPSVEKYLKESEDPSKKKKRDTDPPSSSMIYYYFHLFCEKGECKGSAGYHSPRIYLVVFLPWSMIHYYFISICEKGDCKGAAGYHNPRIYLVVFLTWSKNAPKLILHCVRHVEVECLLELLSKKEFCVIVCKGESVYTIVQIYLVEERESNFRLAAMLKDLKLILRKNFVVNHGDRHIDNARQVLDVLQGNLQLNPLDLKAASDEKDVLEVFSSLIRIDETQKKQKSRVQWLALGDNNNVFFP